MSALRRAHPGDNAALLELFRSVPMEGELVLATRREPDFFSLYNLQRGLTELWVNEEQGRLDGLGALLVREGWLEGRACRVGYLGDLRSRFSARRARGLARLYGPVLEEAAERLGVEAFLTSILASNTAALRALVRKRPGRVAQPHYALVRRFSVVNVHFTHRLRPRPGPYTVRRATAEDVPAMAALLAEDHRRRPFGYRFDMGELEHRLAHWPGLSVERCYLAHDRAGRLVGCTSAWDASAVKRYQVLAWRGRLRWARLGYNALATLLGAPRLPPAGGELRYFYLCNTSVQGEDPRVFRALLEQVYADHYGLGYHFLSLEQGEEDALAPALRGLLQQRLDFHLYAVTPASRPREHFPPGRTGFEVALA